MEVQSWNGNRAEPWWSAGDPEPWWSAGDPEISNSPWNQTMPTAYSSAPLVGIVLLVAVECVLLCRRVPPLCADSSMVVVERVVVERQRAAAHRAPGDWGLIHRGR